MFILAGFLLNDKQLNKDLMRDKFERSNLKVTIEILIFLYGKSSFIKAEVLAAKFNLSQRTIRRLIKDLRDLGYDIISNSGPEGGYKLEKSNIILPINITKQERQIWQNIENTIRGSDLTNRKQALDLIKIIGIQSQLSTYVDTQVYLTKKLLPQVKSKIEKTYEVLLEAINKRQRVEIKYQALNTDDKNLKFQEFRPQQFQVFNNQLYIKGYYTSESESFRTLKLSRFKDIYLINKKYSFNENFAQDNQASAFSKEVYKLYKVELKIKKASHDLLDYQYGENQVVLEFDDYYLLKFELAGNLIIKELVLAMGANCELIEPKSIRDEISTEVKLMTLAYQK